MFTSDVDNKSVLSVLKMEHIVFDELSFKRLGFQQDNEELENEISVSVSQTESDSVYGVTLRYTGHKADEYDVGVQLTGYFEFDGECEEKLRNELLQKNAAAILFPYLRAQLTLLTTQPETEPIIMPVFNINAMLEQAEDEN